jgi:succinate dehydrogenase / fumarate reductase, membrane anchor subunit
MNAAGSRERPQGGWELKAWLFMRYSGILLVFLALGHLFIMHVFNSIHEIDYNFVAARYTRLFWRGYDGLMLWLALIHGMNGIRTILDDFLKGFIQVWAVRLIVLLTIVLGCLGTWVVIFFKPVGT